MPIQSEPLLWADRKKKKVHLWDRSLLEDDIPDGVEPLEVVDVLPIAGDVLPTTGDVLPITSVVLSTGDVLLITGVVLPTTGVEVLVAGVLIPVAAADDFS